MTVYYNDNDPRACATLREMMAEGLIAEGVVDDRSILDVRPTELERYERIHLFAGIGGFELACQLAGWPDGVTLVTGGFPCQPFSVAGRGGRTGDDRYLWPEMLRVVAGRRPDFVCVENVAAIDGFPDFLLDRVCADLEDIGYEVAGPYEIPACAVDAAHQRNRVWVVAHRAELRRERLPAVAGCFGPREDEGRVREPARVHTSALGHHSGDRWREGRASASVLGGRADVPGGGAEFVGDTEGERRRGRTDDADGRRRQCASADPSARAMANSPRLGERGEDDTFRPEPRPDTRFNPTRDEWGPVGWILHPLDQRFRRVPLGLLDPSRVLASPLPPRTTALHGLGNSIVPTVAAEILKAMMWSASLCE